MLAIIMSAVATHIQIMQAQMVSICV